MGHEKSVEVDVGSLMLSLPLADLPASARTELCIPIFPFPEGSCGVQLSASQLLTSAPLGDSQEEEYYPLRKAPTKVNWLALFPPSSTFGAGFKFLWSSRGLKAAVSDHLKFGLFLPPCFYSFRFLSFLRNNNNKKSFQTKLSLSGWTKHPFKSKWKLLKILKKYNRPTQKIYCLIRSIQILSRFFPTIPVL